MKRQDSILVNFYSQKASKLPKFQGDKKGSQVNIPGVTDFKMSRNTSESTSAGAMDRRASANYSAQQGDEVENFIKNYQKQYPGVTREQANFVFNASKRSAQNQGQIKKAAPVRSTISKAAAIATNPMTALKYKVQGKDIPENFERGERNNLDMAVDVINPFSYLQAAKDVRSGINTGDYTQAGLGMLNFIPGKFFGKAASKLDNIANMSPNSISTKQVLNLGTPSVYGTASPNLQFNLNYKTPPSNSNFILSLSPKNIKTSLSNLTEDVGYFFNKPKKIQDIKSERILQKELGQPLTNNKGSFNEGVYRLKRFPENLVKFENTGKVSRGMGFPEYKDFDFVKAMQGIPQDNIAKVSHQLNLPAERRALFMNEVPGQSLYGVDPKIIRNIPESSISDAYSALKKLRNKQLGFDFAGDNFNFNTNSKKINLFDINPIPSNNSQSSFWRDNILKKGDPLTYGIEGSGENLKQALKEKLGRYYQDALNTTIDNAELRKTGLKPSTLASYNNKALNRFDEKLARALDNMDPYKNGGIIEDDMGQWAHPGKVTRIKSRNITMQGVPYPVYAQANNGQSRMMYPGQDYSFPGADYVDEYPMMQKGGIPFLPQQDPEMMYTDRFNTLLSKKEQKEFDEWVAKESERQGRDILMDKGAYDVQGFWKSGDYKKMDQDNHGTDTWKKPNHPTFSNQSKYHGVDGFYGGNWTSEDGYQPSKQSADMYGPGYYNRIFAEEPGRPEHLDASRFRSGVNAPSPLYYKGGGLVKAKDGRETDIGKKDIKYETLPEVVVRSKTKPKSKPEPQEDYVNYPWKHIDYLPEVTVNAKSKNKYKNLPNVTVSSKKEHPIKQAVESSAIQMYNPFTKSSVSTANPGQTKRQVKQSTRNIKGEPLEKSLEDITAMTQFFPHPLVAIPSMVINSGLGLMAGDEARRRGDDLNQNINQTGAAPWRHIVPGWPGKVLEGVGAASDLTDNFGLEQKKNGGLLEHSGLIKYQQKGEVKYPIDLRLSQFRKPGAFFTGYGFSQNPVSNVNVHGVGAYGEGNVNDRMRLSGNVNSASVFYPGGNKMFMKPRFEAGMKYRFDDGGPGPGEGTVLKDKTVAEIRTPVNNLNLRPLFPSNIYEDKNIYDPNCTDPTGVGCSYQATREAMKITGLPLQSYAPANAAFRDAVAERTGLQNIFSQEGEQKKNANSGNKGWKYPTQEDFSKWRAGDVLVLDAPGVDYFPYNAPPGFTEADNSGASHNGVVVGFTENGKPVIRHGYSTGEKGKGKQLTEVIGDDNRVTSLGHGRYAVKSVWRPKEIGSNGTVESIKYVTDTANQQAERKASTENPVSFYLSQTDEEKIKNKLPVAFAFSGASGRLNTKNNLVGLFNDTKLDKELQYKFGITADVLQNLKPVVYGIAGQETNFNDVNSPLAASKDVLGNMLNAGNSKGLFQIKYDSLTEDERKLLDIESPKDLLDDKKAYQAAIVMMNNAYNRMNAEVEKGTHPELGKADPFFRAAYYYNSPARAISTASEWAGGNDPVVPYDPSTWLRPLYVRERPGVFAKPIKNYVENIELRMDKGSYPYKLMQKAKDLNMDYKSIGDDSYDSEIMEPVVVRGLKKDSKSKIYLKN